MYYQGVQYRDIPPYTSLYIPPWVHLLLYTLLLYMLCSGTRTPATALTGAVVKRDITDTGVTILELFLVIPVSSLIRGLLCLVIPVISLVIPGYSSRWLSVIPVIPQ